MRHSCGDGNCLFLYCINASVLVVILSYRFTRGHYWEKLGKGDLGFSRLNIMLHFKEALQVLPMPDDYGPHLLQNDLTNTY